MDLSEEIKGLALDTLRGGWFRYGHLSNQEPIRCIWQQEGSERWLQVENLETGDKTLFTLDVTVTPLVEESKLWHYWPKAGTGRTFLCDADNGFRTNDTDNVTCPECRQLLADAEIGAHLSEETERELSTERSTWKWDPDYPGCAPEECGGSRLDPCSTVMKTEGRAHDGEVTDHPFTVGAGATGMVCTAMVMRNGGGDSCGLPVSAHLPEHRWAAREATESIPSECANCAPLAGAGSTTRVDGTGPDAPCEDCRETFPHTWNQVRTGDEVQGEDGNWYLVKGSGASTLLDGQYQVVTLLIGERENTYDMPGLGPVRIRLGDEHRAIRALKAGFPGTEEIR